MNIKERAPNGWPFPKGVSEIQRAFIEARAPINEEFEAEIEAAMSGMKDAVDEKDAIVKKLQDANAKVAIAQGNYCHVIRRLNEWRESIKAADQSARKGE